MQRFGLLNRRIANRAMRPSLPVRTMIPVLRPFTTSLPTRHSQQEDMHNNKVCWKCDQVTSRAAVSCTNQDCGVIQPTVPNLNFYELLRAGTGENSSDPTFDVDAKTLKRHFLKLQQVAHPDSYSNASKREHKYAEIQSSLLNKAYQTLKDPLARAHYMLGQHGMEVNEAESLHNPVLLMDVMEVREELEEAETEEDVERIKQANDVLGKHSTGHCGLGAWETCRNQALGR
ncbi:hypothetical protein [Absidia glauca]|uniref:J domain-containing protein n=1 Tax=Absidia glauca TaxID=4829 RepID=A0A163M0J3_ABSGL|nr:hypothetical protein [Absidia glauca]